MRARRPSCACVYTNNSCLCARPSSYGRRSQHLVARRHVGGAGERAFPGRFEFWDVCVLLGCARLIVLYRVGGVVVVCLVMVVGGSSLGANGAVPRTRFS